LSEKPLLGFVGQDPRRQQTQRLEPRKLSLAQQKESLAASNSLYSSVKCNVSSEAQSDISSEFVEEGLDGREVVGHDDLLEVFVGEVVDVGLPRQPPA
jgi:hypothetical protein